MNFLIFFGANFIRLVSFYKFNKIFCSMKTRYNKYIYLSLYLLLALLLSLINTYDSSSLNVFANIISLIIISTNFKFSFQQRVITFIIYIAFSFFIEALGILSVTGITYHIHESNKNVLLFLSMYFVECIKLGIIMIFGTFKKQLDMHLPNNIILWQSMIFLMSTLCCIFIVVISWKTEQLKVVILSSGVIIIIIGMNVLSLYIFEKMNQIQSDALSKELLIGELRAKEDYYTAQEKYLHEMRHFRHDINNKLLTINENISKCEEERALISQLFGGLSMTKPIIYTSNMAVNAVINHKFELANSYNIKYTYDIFIPPKIKMNYGEIGVLFGNLLDNAIEACLEIKEDERVIDIQCHYKEGNLILIIKNSIKPGFIPNLKKSSKKFLNKNHGFGLQSVKSVIEKYNGHLEPTIDYNTFTICIILYSV